MDFGSQIGQVIVSVISASLVLLFGYTLREKRRTAEKIENLETRQTRVEVTLQQEVDTRKLLIDRIDALGEEMRQSRSSVDSKFTHVSEQIVDLKLAVTRHTAYQEFMDKPR